MDLDAVRMEKLLNRLLSLEKVINGLMDTEFVGIVIEMKLKDLEKAIYDIPSKYTELTNQWNNKLVGLWQRHASLVKSAANEGNPEQIQEMIRQTMALSMKCTQPHDRLVEDGQSESSSKRASFARESSPGKRKTSETPSCEPKMTASGAYESKEHQHDAQQYVSQQQQAPFSSTYQLSSSSWNNQPYPASRRNRTSYNANSRFDRRGAANAHNNWRPPLPSTSRGQANPPYGFGNSGPLNQNQVPSGNPNPTDTQAETEAVDWTSRTTPESTGAVDGEVKNPPLSGLSITSLEPPPIDLEAQSKTAEEHENEETKLIERMDALEVNLKMALEDGALLPLGEAFEEQLTAILELAGRLDAASPLGVIWLDTKIPRILERYNQVQHPSKVTPVTPQVRVTPPPVESQDAPLPPAESSTKSPSLIDMLQEDILNLEVTLQQLMASRPLNRRAIERTFAHLSEIIETFIAEVLEMEPLWRGKIIQLQSDFEMVALERQRV